jgi:hypothetical protein
MPDSESYSTKLLRFWAPNGWTALWLALGLAPLFFFETCVHEGIHWMTGKAAGGDPTLIPFAHFNTNFGRNVNGATMSSPGFIAMPQILCLVLLVALILVFIFTSPSWRGLRTFLTWWYLGLAIDLLFNTGRGLVGAPRQGTDWGKFAASSGDGLATFLSWIILLAVLSQLGWIVVSKWHRNRPPALASFEFRGVAAAFGVLSLIALIVSLTVEHPAIQRNWWFWLVWLYQLLSLGWYAGYIGWATKRRG